MGKGSLAARVYPAAGGRKGARGWKARKAGRQEGVMELAGVYPITPTPFTPDGAVDAASLRRLVEFLVGARVQGIAILGFLGENQKLSTSERELVMRTVSEQSAGRLQVLVGVRAFGTAGAVEQAVSAREHGADAVFVAPVGVQDDGVLFDFYRDVAAESGVPVMIHDYPASFGTLLSARLIGRLANEAPGVVGIKLEDPPVLTKLSRVLELAPDFAVFGGLGGVYFLEELQRGARGIMTGFAFPEVLVEIFEKYRAGDEAAAAAAFDRYCPLLRYEFQPGVGLAFRKHVYRERGVFASDRIRPPGARLDERTRAEFEGVIRRVGLDLAPVTGSAGGAGA